MVHLKLIVLLNCFHETIITTRDTGVPIIIQFQHNGVLNGFSVYLMTQSLESHNPDKINGPSKVNSLAYCFHETIITTRDSGVPIIIQLQHNGVLALIDSYLLLYNRATEVTIFFH